MSAPLRTALVGCGKIGRTHALALTRLPESQFVGCCDADAARSAAFAAEFGGTAHASVDDLLRSARPEALLIATPHPLHAAPAVAALEAGVHVLVEKPLAATVEDCDAMLDAADRGGATLGVVSQRRYYEPVVRMRRAIDAGKIGRPVLGLFLMYSWRDPAYYRSDPWRGRWATKDGAGEGGGVLVNQSPHQLDLLQWFLGEPEEVTGYWANLNHPTVEVEDSAVAALRFRGGGLGSILTSLSQDPGIYTKVHVHGSNGASVGVQTDTGASFVAGVSGIADPPLNDVWTIAGEQGELEAFRRQDAAAFAAVDGTTHYHELNIADFLRAVRDGAQPPVTGAEGRTVVAMFQAIYESNRTGRSVRLH
ncbi:Gfo/Idh/MocA family protein [Alienimonas californiensis]|uniref:1,5-anhydro-D-fructose reductase n=1 Tax=Alienimonas californiensis TaxID=2527989 RepID=A0A517PCR3_9PLAN|nr:Gfo/Idh/MocA family oxidoreductase [Alienimonas californiensis]QDT17160.1 1,5-anhydro-D-fructose reductase [Alienimonas californiensis]